MRKIFIVIPVILILMLSSNVDDKVVIPNEAIRLRVIANSNSKHDVMIKEKVSEELQSNLSSILKDVNNIDDARLLVNKNIPLLDLKIANLLKSEKQNIGYKLNYGLNFFPEKQFKGVIYKEGHYESLKVTLGEALGDNWWCVLFPPFCLLEAEETDEVEYKLFVKEIIKKYF